MPDSIAQAHDKFFKALLGNKAEAISFVQNYLPPNISRHLNLPDLEIRKDSFIEDDLKTRFSDVLYLVPLKNGSPVYLYLLFEHKSYPDAEVFWQLFKYMADIWEQERKQGQTGHWPILPLVFYHGPQRWTLTTQFAELFDVPPDLLPYIPYFNYHLVDLSTIPDEQIRGTLVLQVGLTLLKYIQQDEVTTKILQMADLLRTLLHQETGLEMLHTVLVYLSQGTDKIPKDDFVSVLKQVFEEKGDEIMPTLAQQWIAEGVEVGREEGREKGREEGIHIGKEMAEAETRQTLIETIGKIIALRFEQVPDHNHPHLERLSLDELKTLSDLAFEADTLAEFETALAEQLEPNEPPDTPTN